MKNTVKVRINPDNLPWKARLRAIEEGSCKGFFRAGFVKHDNYVAAFFNTEAYCSLSSMKKINIVEALNIIKALLLNLYCCENKMFFANEFVLSIDTVFYSDIFDDVKFLYIPVKKLCSEEAALGNLIAGIKNITDGTGNESIEYIITCIKSKKYKTESLMAILDELSAEAQLYIKN